MQAVTKLVHAFMRVLANEEKGFDFSWASGKHLGQAIRWLFDLEHPSSYIGDIKIDAPMVRTTVF